MSISAGLLKQLKQLEMEVEAFTNSIEDLQEEFDSEDDKEIWDKYEAILDEIRTITDQILPDIGSLINEI